MRTIGFLIGDITLENFALASAFTSSNSAKLSSKVHMRFDLEITFIVREAFF